MSKILTITQLAGIIRFDHFPNQAVVGITGTRGVANSYQAVTLARVLALVLPQQLHHGDCVGVDELAHNIAQRRRIDIEIHPPENDRLRAYCEGAVVVHDPLPYDQRNQAIVDASDFLIAVPAMIEELSERSGTWMTVNMARRREIPRVIVYRNKLEVE